MNDRNLAIQVSKHPLIRKLLETKMATTSVVARLIVEEMMIDEAPADIVANVKNTIVNWTNGQIERNKSKTDILNVLKNSMMKPHSRWLAAIETKAGEDDKLKEKMLAQYKKSLERMIKKVQNEYEPKDLGSVKDQVDAIYDEYKKQIPQIVASFGEGPIDKETKEQYQQKLTAPLSVARKKMLELGIKKEDNRYAMAGNIINSHLENLNMREISPKPKFTKEDASVFKGSSPRGFSEQVAFLTHAATDGYLFKIGYGQDSLLIVKPEGIKSAIEKMTAQDNIPENGNGLTRAFSKDNRGLSWLKEKIYNYDVVEKAVNEHFGVKTKQPETKVEKVVAAAAETAEEEQQKQPDQTQEEAIEQAVEEVIPDASEEQKQEIGQKVKDKLEQADEKQTPEKIFKTGFDEDEQKILTKYRDFVREKQPITESGPIGIETAMKVNSQITKEFMNTLHDTPELPILQRAFAKVMKDQNLLKGVNWLFDQEQPEQPDDTGEEAEEEEEEKVEDFQVSENTLAALKGSVKEFITEFYEVPFLTDQAKLVKAIMNALAEVKKELEKEPEQQARMQGQRRQQNEQEEQAPASEDLLKNIRVDLRAFLKLTKKTKAALKIFKSNAEKGSFMTDSSKKEFMKLIARLQMTIAEIVGELKKMSPMNEQEEPQEEKEDWEKAQDFYNEAADALDGLVKTLGDGGPADSPKELIDTASKNLFSLTQFFPSVNPFSAGKKDLGDITEYDAEFDEAVKEVKSHVQSILALVKERVGGQATIGETIVGLEEFSGKIQNIFGTESNLEGVKVSPEDDPLEGKSAEEPTSEPAEEEVEQEIEELPAEEQEVVSSAEVTLKKYFEFIKKLIDGNNDTLREGLKTKIVRALGGKASQDQFFVSLADFIGKKTKDKGQSIVAAANKLRDNKNDQKRFKDKDVRGALDYLWFKDLGWAKGNERTKFWDAYEITIGKNLKIFNTGIKGSVIQKLYREILATSFKNNSEEPETPEEDEEIDDEVTSVAKTIMRDFGPNEITPEEAVEKLAKSTNLAQVSEDDFGEIKKQLNRERFMDENPNWYQKLFDIFSNKKKINQSNRANAENAIQDIQNAKNVDDMIKVKVNFLKNSNTLEKLKDAWLKKFRKLSMKFIDNATADMDDDDKATLLKLATYTSGYWSSNNYPNSSLFGNPPKEKEDLAIRKAAYAKVKELGIEERLEERLVNKLKPLIREMLTKGK